MRPTLLGLVVVLTACGDATSAVDDGVTDGAAIATDASAAACPRARDLGVLAASWHGADGCYYACDATGYRLCDGVMRGLFTYAGRCVPLDDDRNCGACGNACGSGTRCRVSPQGAQFGYACLP